MTGIPLSTRYLIIFAIFFPPSNLTASHLVNLILLAFLYAMDLFSISFIWHIKND